MNVILIIDNEAPYAISPALHISKYLGFLLGNRSLTKGPTAS